MRLDLQDEVTGKTKASEECSSTLAYLKHFASEIAYGLAALAQRQGASGWRGDRKSVV